mmetsp:Transcript_27226/g.65563  ORF Transcript_27226/g.65563 Transcript_27226/m.65563 type:complete len:671 (+) Transcript_27226:102-2114(+)
MRVSVTMAGAVSATLSLKTRPITKVVNLLKDMSHQLEEEAKQDQEVYDKLVCWCKNSDEDKSRAVQEASAKVSDLQAAIEEGAARKAQLEVEIKQAEKEAEANKKALNTARAMREKASADFNEEEKDLIQSVQALKNAITVLSRNQNDEETLVNVRTVMRHEMRKHEDLLQRVITPSTRKTITGMLQAPEYNAQSSEILGILKSMKDTMEADLSDAQKEEIRQQDSFSELKAAKENEIKAGDALLDDKMTSLAETQEELQNNKEEFEDTSESLSADQKFLTDLKSRCQSSDVEFAQRQEERNKEMVAISDAIGILTDDDAFDVTGRALGFVQVSSSSAVAKEAQRKVAEMLRKAAVKTHSQHLAALAMMANLDVFDKVKKAIDHMAEELRKEQKDEVKHRDFCVGELNQNEKNVAVKDRERVEHESRISDLEMGIKSKAKTIKEAKAEIAETQLEIKEAGQNREKENADFQATVQDQRATQDILAKALAKLKAVYAPKKEESQLQKNKATMDQLFSGSLLQKKGKQPATPPPEGFKKMEKNGGGGGAVALLESILSDSKSLEAQAVRAERKAQSDYESFVADSNAAIEKLQVLITTKSDQISKDKGLKVMEKTDHTNTLAELEQLSLYEGDLHKECDFLMKHFETRQTARSEEIKALEQAKAILSGANFD